MIVYATKLTVKKAVCGVLAVCGLIWGAGALGDLHAAAVSVSGESGSIACKLRTNEERVEFLERFGISVEDTPVTEAEVRIPEVFDAEYTAYNELQKTMGLDLEAHRGKKAMLYIYAVEDDPSGEEGVTASLLLRRNRLIAADVSSAETDGFMRALTGGSSQ
jgi:hypothetical protein